MIAQIRPSGLHGSLMAIPSKSAAHRLLIAAALSDKPTELILNSTSRDIEATCECLKALNIGINHTKGKIIVTPFSHCNNIPLLDCNESGSTLRFMLPVACVLLEEVAFTGKGRLPLRPLVELISVMKKNGVTFSQDSLPFSTKGKLKSGVFELPGNVSSQYISGLLMALSVSSGESILRLTTPLESSSYVDLTLHVLRKFGAHIDVLEGEYHIIGMKQLASPGTLKVEGDWSNSAFYLAAGAIRNGIRLTGLSGNSVQGDKKIVSVLKNFGAQVTCIDDCIIVSAGKLTGCVTDVSETPDLAPVIAVLGACASGETVVKGGSRLREKESDRIVSVVSMIKALGGKIKETEDGFIINGTGKLSGGTVNSFNDHRIVMASAIASTICEGDVTINGAEAVNKSYPGFFEDFNSLGGISTIIK